MAKKSGFRALIATFGSPWLDSEADLYSLHTPVALGTVPGGEDAGTLYMH